MADPIELSFKQVRGSESVTTTMAKNPEKFGKSGMKYGIGGRPEGITWLPLLFTWDSE